MIVRAYNLDYTIKYDQQNRVYVVPGKIHHGTGKFAGLCGNFNGRDDDDFTKLDNSLAKNALKFAETWSDQSTACPELTEAVDTCAANSDRLAWAQKGMRDNV